MTIGARVVIASLFKKLIVIRYCKANETAHYCCIFDYLDALCDTTTKLDIFVVLQAFDYNITMDFIFYHGFCNVTMVFNAIMVFQFYGAVRESCGWAVHEGFPPPRSAGVPRRNRSPQF